MGQDSSVLRSELYLGHLAQVPKCTDSSESPNQSRSVSSPNFLGSEVSGSQNSTTRKLAAKITNLPRVRMRSGLMGDMSLVKTL